LCLKLADNIIDINYMIGNLSTPEMKFDFIIYTNTKCLKRLISKADSVYFN